MKHSPPKNRCKKRWSINQRIARLTCTIPENQRSKGLSFYNQCSGSLNPNAWWWWTGVPPNFTADLCFPMLIPTNSIVSLPIQDFLALAHNATSSRVLDVVFESPTVPFKAKRGLVSALIGHYHELVDDRIGSRVCDRIWAFADPYLRVRTAPVTGTRWPTDVWGRKR